MSDPTPTIGEPRDEFSLPAHGERSLRDLVDAADFDAVHFFIEEGLEEDAIAVAPAAEDVTFALLPYEHPDNAVNSESFDLIEDAGYEPATFRDLLAFAIERPGVQLEYDVVALGTLRTRRVYDEREGETVWDQRDLDKSICQWATGLSDMKQTRTLVPVEIYLDKVLRKDTLLLVRRS